MTGDTIFGYLDASHRNNAGTPMCLDSKKEMKLQNVGNFKLRTNQQKRETDHVILVSEQAENSQ